jgi:(2Fe-2S) ferredoxin
MVGLPDGIGYKGLTAAPANEIIEQHRLDTWIVEEDWGFEPDED